ncbi:MAG: toll/interleukin-1 receptor domain-containing protein [Deltaproteobacteria bacterium]|jgi:hypothetical protein|nr:toll/interleukin-1 receptor domain-containing protein [Deltaproteobacteria bacterium]
MTSRELNPSVKSCTPDDGPFVFISYSHSDSAVILPIIEAISHKGYRVWFDGGINISSTWTDEIALAIRNCQVLIAFISAEAANSNYVRVEIEYALNNRIKVIPVYLDGMDVLPPGLALGLNATQGITDTSDPKNIVTQIVKALEFNAVPRLGEISDIATTFIRRRCRLLTRLPKHFTKIIIALLALSLLGVIVLSITAKPPQTPSTVTIIQVPKEIPLSLELDKTQYTPGQSILPRLNYQGDIPERLVIGIAPSGSEAKTITTSIFPTDSSPVINAPTAPGQYEIRLYNSSEELSDKTLIQSIPITVTSSSLGAFNVDIEKTSFSLEEDFEVKVDSVPQSMILDGAMVGLYRLEASGDDFIYYINIDHREETLFFDAPKQSGQYEVRAYSTNRKMGPDTIVAVILITVGELELELEQSDEN